MSDYNNNPQEFIWTEKYRPNTIKDCILPNALHKVFTALVSDPSGEIPHMLFSGTAGVGKTTVAKAICAEMNLDYIIINGSMEGNIDTLRTRIRQFASTVSLQGGYKVVILDEADYVSAQSTQPALRGFMEEFAENCRFILTCNFKNRVIEPIQSRCSNYDFSIPAQERPSVASKMFLRIKDILKNEGVNHEDRALAVVVEKYFPDFRRTINECQRFGINGAIDASAVVASGGNDHNVAELISALKDKSFGAMRKWVSSNSDIEPPALFRLLFNELSNHLGPQALSQVILILAEYSYKATVVPDQELNTVACMVEIMATVDAGDWK